MIMQLANMTLLIKFRDGDISSPIYSYKTSQMKLCINTPQKTIYSIYTGTSTITFSTVKINTK